MQRRKFLVGAGGTALGGSGLIGSGAFTRTESQRQVSIEVADDTDAYLGLDGCPGSPNNSYTEDDGRGHLTVEMDPDNPTDAGGQGINSDSLSAFDDVFRICNQGKQDVCVWIDADVIDPGHTSEPVVDFYVLDGDGNPRSILGVEQAVKLPIGECLCVGIRTYSRFLSEGDQLITDNEAVIKADVNPDIEYDETDDGECPEINGEVPPGEEPQNGQAISWIAFCGEGLSASEYTVSSSGDEPTIVTWNGPTPDNVVVFGASRLFNTSGKTVTLSGDEIEWRSGQNKTEQRPPSPCPDGQCGPKFDWTGSGFEAVGHQDECSDNDD